jgi:hypothetical protein
MNIFYLGNLDIAMRRVHGNSKLTTSHLSNSTLLSTIRKIDTLVTEMSGSKAYKHLSTTNDDPRDVAQCQYRCQKFLKQRKIKKDEIENLVRLLFDLNNYFNILQIQPELQVVLIHEQMKEEFSKLLLITKETIPLYYATMFSIGEIYVSVGTIEKVILFFFKFRLLHTDILSSSNNRLFRLQFFYMIINVNEHIID